MRQVGSVLWPKLRVLQVYGANTGVGKTIFSSILCRAFKKRLDEVNYLKPVSTGPLEEADDHHISTLGTGVTTKCLFQFDDPVSPHLAVRSAGKPICDAEVQTAIHEELCRHAKALNGISIVETAGGVLSPSPSGSSQADLYRPFRLPTILVGDHQLGGIGTTISAWESLHIRGYDVHSVALFVEDRYDNHSYLKEYFGDRKINTIAIPPPPERNSNVQEDQKAMRAFYERSSGRVQISAFVDQFLLDHEKRISELCSMPEEADQAIWHPFVQHTERSKDTIMAWDSAYGDHFQSYSTKQEAALEDFPDKSLLTPAFDGSASWWTQGLGHGNPSLALTAAHAAGRYGHVMFGGAIHKPGLDLAQTVIKKSGNPRLSKVFYSDNGSTGMEVAVKMALRASVERYQVKDPKNVSILGLKNSYHGDTIGTMDCSEPSIFNEKVEWYKGRGLWLDFPTVKMREGQWLVEPFEGAPFETQLFGSLSDLFDFDQREAEYNAYQKYLKTAISTKVAGGNLTLGALILEPILLGAGGMMFADPLYQRCLVEVAREFNVEEPSDFLATQHSNEDNHDWSGIPVIFDEVFTGLYRLGRFSAASFLGIQPDIVVNAKLLTGGLLPLCTTTASQSIFEAFLSNDKTDALLHGHSYTAHPMGCAVANESLRQLQDLDRGGAWENFKEDWSPRGTSHGVSYQGSEQAWSMWSWDFVSNVSHKANVDNVFALGSVLAITLKDPAGSGYASTAATGLRDKMLAGDGTGNGVVHSRVLGNVLYLMAAMTTPEETLRDLEGTVSKALE
ncbi:Bifunctional dethiobiotin synthetase/adenosylmethionine-8-amino-7-oxononanoate aminotransferase [Fulvia fulva]|uniref:Bifunctional dethiobiotin synthetase/adenosylmethionine-8-amino-7-oxononanoate aminotransferase n=1 Tax=Passalora fulva TaxID=5499 RepID=A0A9Q8PJH5_PASFU|nr:Bifunctional dethiobiotin synthetase/adenosylmethionine-8-amino-7-oxononanoate aminotransferase [Fulvia fulva]KAK4612052.1 Bifunctional dethiobiotin synthetase/adenosylmethionine-8-amino-7-oxononanoate aminotransferase [Fulvia fulva]UJO23537.1 Bifunctional dethiobiotin synthetase/adenosylmethionine-8-amino-7-oxononanoate aminotransferase [Fulvia fulva]WPV20909.1 Bifunctional dethiobiotin synthetase/adenosylmethionine-8-amino-7-oxononanoate aminotransferase [Fulvia fulva]WPV36375.1 Bifunction